MPRSHPPYSPELRRRLVEMVRAGRSLFGRTPYFGLIGGEGSST